jgi:hypothetical protein
MKWGLVVTLFYGLVVLAFLVPAYILLASKDPLSAADFLEAYSAFVPWACTVAVMLGAALLLWLSVDTTKKRLKPRTRILTSALITGFFLSFLTVAIFLAAGLGVWGERFFNFLPGPPTLAGIAAAFVVPWLVWGILFYRFCRNSADPVTRALAWMFRGSVLELLIAVPAHVFIRRRHECCAPLVNSFGITAGIAIMLLSFGPSVLLLYKKRLEKYAPKDPAKE